LPLRALRYAFRALKETKRFGVFGGYLKHAVPAGDRFFRIPLAVEFQSYLLEHRYQLVGDRGIFTIQGIGLLKGLTGLVFLFFL